MFKNMPRHDSFMPQHVQISEANTKTRSEERRVGKECSRTCRGMTRIHAAACADFKPKSKTREEHAAAWPIHAAACHVKSEKASFKACRSTPYSCRSMRTFDSLGYFWTLGQKTLM